MSQVERVVARVLFWGGLNGVALMVVGMVLETVGVPRHPIPPAGVSAAGIVLLLATPMLGLAAAIVGFWEARDTRYCLIAGAVLAALLLSAALGIAR